MNHNELPAQLAKALALLCNDPNMEHPFRALLDVRLGNLMHERKLAIQLCKNVEDLLEAQFRNIDPVVREHCPSWAETEAMRARLQAFRTKCRGSGDRILFNQVTNNMVFTMAPKAGFWAEYYYIRKFNPDKTDYTAAVVNRQGESGFIETESVRTGISPLEEVTIFVILDFEFKAPQPSAVPAESAVTPAQVAA